MILPIVEKVLILHLFQIGLIKCLYLTSQVLLIELQKRIISCELFGVYLLIVKETNAVMLRMNKTVVYVLVIRLYHMPDQT